MKSAPSTRLPALLLTRSLHRRLSDSHPPTLIFNEFSSDKHGGGIEKLPNRWENRKADTERERSDENSSNDRARALRALDFALLSYIDCVILSPRLRWPLLLPVTKTIKLHSVLLTTCSRVTRAFYRDVARFPIYL